MKDNTSNVHENTVLPFMYLQHYDHVKLQTPQLFDLRGHFDISQIGVVLISNAMNILGLPYLTSDPRFKGKIYATEPTVQIGRKYMEELVAYVKRGERTELQTHEKRNHQQTKFIDEQQRLLWEKYENAWKMPYTNDDILKCIQRITPLSYSQSVSIYGAFSVTAISSGYNLGSANWMVQTEFEKIVYISTSSTATARHPEALAFRDLKGADVCILADINRHERPLQGPQTMDRNILYNNMVTLVSEVGDNAASMLNELGTHISAVVGAGGDVLIPCYASGLIYDLIDYLRVYLNSINLQSTNMFFVSPVADHSLAYSNISTEWLCEKKQDNMSIAEPPFLHQGMVKTKQLYVFDHVNAAFAQTFNSNRANPSVIFAGHPNLRMGDVLHLIKILQPNPKNACICIDGETTSQFDKLVAPFVLTNENKMRWIHCPIDLRLKRNEVVQVLKEIAPDQLVIPTQVLSRLDMKSVSAQVGRIHTLDNKKPIYVKLNKRKFEQAKIMSDLAMEVQAKQIKGCKVSRVNAALDANDGNYRLKRVKLSEKEKPASGGALFGDQISVEQVIRSLQSEGYEVEVSQVQDSIFGVYHINIPGIKCKIVFSPEQTHITAPNNELRSHLKQVLMKNYLVL
jgi:integrator complex subunit 9